MGAKQLVDMSSDDVEDVNKIMHQAMRERMEGINLYQAGIAAHMAGKYREAGQRLDAGIFSVPDTLLVTSTVYSQCLTPYWTHLQYILSA
jgi:hypothetical protein